MSGIDPGLTSLTENLVRNFDGIKGDSEEAQRNRESLMREFVAQARKRLHTTGGGEEGRKDIAYDLEKGWVDAAPVATVVPPRKPDEEAKTHTVKCRRTRVGDYILATTVAPRIGSVLGVKIEEWGTGNVEEEYMSILKVEPIWDVEGIKRHLCQVEKL